MQNHVDAETLAGFVEEVRGYLPKILSGIEQFYADPSRTDSVEIAHRHVHSIRVLAAAMVGLPDLDRMVDHFEETLAQVLDGKTTLTRDALDGFHNTMNGLERSLNEVVAQRLALPADLPPLPDRPNLPPDDDLDELFALIEKSSIPTEEPPSPADSSAAAPEGHETDPVAPEFVEAFRIEAEEHLQKLHTLLPVLRQQPDQKDVVQQIRRSAHTLKGSAAMVGFRGVTQLAHRMEDLLDLLFDGRRSATPDMIELLVASTDILQDLTAGQDDPQTLQSLYVCYDELLGPAPDEAPVTLAESAERGPAPELPVAPTERFLRVPSERLDGLVKLVGELVVNRSGFEQRLTALREQMAELRASIDRLQSVSTKLETQYEASTLGGRLTGFPSRDTLIPSPPLNLETHGFDDLEFDRYTEFHLLNRQLAETTTDVQTVSGELGRLLGDCDGLLTRQGRLTSEVESKLMRLRLLPLTTLAPRLQRTVRSVAGQLGKEVDLVLEGEATELDKTVLEEMTDPLLHLLRNAVDHGIEPAEVRQACGKPARGTIRLRARRDGGQIVLEIHDDGGGIDLENLRTTAVARGLLAEAETAPLSAEELRELLFLPGFSTAREVSEVSGRGVGLDVVKAHVHKLEGSIKVESEVGRGTTFTLRLPLTLAMGRAVLVKAQQETFAIPLDAVLHILRLEPEVVMRYGSTEAVRVGDEKMPLLRLGQVLNLKKPSEEGPRPPLLVIRAGFRSIAVVVDEILGAREIVVKGLGTHLRQVPGVGGATILGDGRVVLIVNPNELIRPAVKIKARPATPAPRPRGALRVLVVDDSPSLRQVAMSLIAGRGWTSTGLRDGLEALEHLERSTALPDVVLLDVEMPRMDGYELLAALKAEPKYRDIPVILVTSRAGDKHRRRGFELGASAYVVKPFQEQALLGLVERLGSERAEPAIV